MIIGISGKIHSGKDYLARAIQSVDPAWEERRFMGDPKRIGAQIAGFYDQQTREGKAHYLDDWGMTVGVFQQRLGQALRSIHNDALLIMLFRHYRPESSRWVIPDVRDYNEADAIKHRGGILVRIDGIHYTCQDESRDRGHISETALDDYDGWDWRFDNENGNDAFIRRHAVNVLRLVANE